MLAYFHSVYRGPAVTHEQLSFFKLSLYKNIVFGIYIRLCESSRVYMNLSCVTNEFKFMFKLDYELKLKFQLSISCD
jgi:hypothetical protein